jgi:hypothetical protein
LHEQYFAYHRRIDPKQLGFDGQGHIDPGLQVTRDVHDVAI